MNDIACTGGGFDHEKLKKITMRQVAVNALGRKSLGILTAVNRILPCRAKGCHDMAADAEGIGIGGLNHKTGCQHRYDSQNNADNSPEPPALFATAWF
jgi:hypothetical protein